MTSRKYADPGIKRRRKKKRHSWHHQLINQLPVHCQSERIGGGKDNTIM